MHKFIHVLSVGIISILVTNSVYSQSADSIEAQLGSIIPTGSLTTGFSTSNLLSIMAAYEGGGSLTQANTDFQNEMTLIFSSVSGDTDGYITNYSSAVNQIIANDFAAFIEAFGIYYGEAVLLSSHLSYPVGYDRIDKYPGIILGFGGGTAFSNITAIQDSLSGDSATLFSNLSVLPTLGISLNGGIGINKLWSIRFSIFPHSSISLPTSAAQLQDMNLSFNFGSYRARVSYLLIDDKGLGAGMSLSLFAGYTSGTLILQTTEQSLTPIVENLIVPSSGPLNSETNINVKVTPSYYSEAICTWSNITAGPELRIWLNLKFFIPYIGYGLGFQYAQVDTAFNLNTNILLEQTSEGTLDNGSPTPQKVTASSTETKKSVSTISYTGTGSLLQHRIILGTEFKIVMVRLNAEVIFDPVSSIMGLSFGFNTAF